LKQENLAAASKLRQSQSIRSAIFHNTNNRSQKSAGSQCHSAEAHEEVEEVVVDLAAAVEDSEVAVEADEEDFNQTMDHQMQSLVSDLARASQKSKGDMDK
jgi:hypothetical protein